MDISTGKPETHESLLPLDGSQSPALAGVTQAFPSEVSGEYGEEGAVYDATGARLSQLSAAEAAIAASQSVGHSAEMDRRGGYLESLLRTGADYATQLDLPQPPSGPGIGITHVPLPVQGDGY